MIFIGSYLGGRIQDSRGPRSVALTGGVIYSIGVVLASFATADSFWLLVLGYGVLGGFGLGMVYIVPIAMLQKWFPDRKGLITGLAVGGFGFGAVLTSPVAQRLIDQAPDDPTSALRRAAFTDGDSDSIASITGALAGAAYGLSAFPSHWIGNLEYRRPLENLAIKLTAASGR
jgi:MFS family permease